MKLFQGQLQALLVAILATSFIGNAQTSLGLRQSPATYDLTLIKAKSRQDVTYFALGKPIAPLSPEDKLTRSLVYLDESRPMPSMMHHEGPDKKQVGIGLLIGGGVCLIAGGILFVAAGNTGSDNWGLDTLVYDIGGGILTGCGLGLSIPGLVLVLRNSGGSRVRHY